MSTIFQIITYFLSTFFALSKAEAECDFNQLQNLTQYNAFSSLTKMPYAPDGNLPNDSVNYMGYKGQVAGVNDNGTLYFIGGIFDCEVCFGGAGYRGPLWWWHRINVYDSYIAYDDSVDLGLTKLDIQLEWNSSLPYYSMPDITPPDSFEYIWPDYAGTNSGGPDGGFYCSLSQCSTYLNNRIYIINPIIISTGLAQDRAWDKLVIFDMNDTNPRYLSETEFISNPPYNYYASGITNDTNLSKPFDAILLSGDGCTTHNNTHIFHFNYIDDAYTDYEEQITYAYHPDTDIWTQLTGNTAKKFNFGCSSDVSGRYLYLFAGTSTFEQLGTTGLISLPTDKYDTYTDTWVRLPSTADYPESYGREEPLCILDKTTHSVLVTGGESDLAYCSKNCDISPNKVEIFRLRGEDWYIPDDEKDLLYVADTAYGVSAVKVDNFMPNGQNTNVSADMIFFLGGGSNSWKNYISFITVLTEWEYYPNDAFIIEGQHPSSEDIETSAFDPWQRFEFAFRIVITDGMEFEIDFDSWSVEFVIDGKSLDELNEEYDTQIMTRPACQCWGNECENMPNNVKQVTIVEFMIPSHRALHNGYCVDRDAPWIFNHNTTSIVTVTASNGTYNRSEDFEFAFTEIALITEKQANASGVIRGCKVMNESNGVLTHFVIQCDGYTCATCPTFDGIGRDDKGGRLKDYLQNEIEYNILMNDVLLAPGAWVRQDVTEESVIGTESLDKDSLIAVIRARTAAGTWYQQCEYDFFFEFQQEWQSLNEILNGTTNQDLWDDIIEKLNSENNEDVVAAYSVLNEMISDNEVPPGEDPQQEISNALTNIMDRIDTDNNITIDDITGDVALVDLLTSNPDIVDPNIVLNISNEWLPIVLEITLDLFADSETEYEPGVLADTVQNIGAISNSAATNLLNISNITESDRQQLLQDVQYLMSTGLEGSWTGEVIIHVTDGSSTKGYTTTDTQCEFDDNIVSIPPSVTGNGDAMKCVMTLTDVYELAINLFDSTGTRVYSTNDSCFPYFISMNVPQDVGSAYDAALSGDWYNTSVDYPSCTFWNKSSSIWDTEGCWVYAFDNDSVTCACTHLTTFQVRGSDFDPKAELLSPSDIRELNSENIQSHPTTWVTMLMIVVVLFVACVCVPNNNADKPIIAFEDIIYKEFRDQYLHKHQQWHEIQQIDRWYSKIAETKRELSELESESYASSGLFALGAESPITPDTPDTPSVNKGNMSFPSTTTKLKYKTRRSKYYCLLSVNLFETYLKNDHTVLSVFQRTDGTNFSTKQRIALFLLYMYMIMMADAVFYGRQTERRPMGELTASAAISLIGTVPVYIIRILFQWSKPRVVKSVKIRSEKAIPLMVAATHMKVANAHSNQPPDHDDESMSVSNSEERKERQVAARERLSTHYWTAIAELKATSRPDMKLVRKCMHYVDTKAGATEKAQLAAEIRLILFNYNYPFAHWCKRLAWFVLIFAAGFCMITSVLYGLRFDIKSQQMAAQIINEVQVWDEIANLTNVNGATYCNLSHRMYAESRVLSSQITFIREEQDRIASLDESYPDDFLFAGDIYDSTKWLLNVLISFLTSVFLWQPMSIYFLTWIKIWAFHNGLIMESSIYNLFVLLCGCCICSNKKNKMKNQMNSNMKDCTVLTTTASGVTGTATTTGITITAPTMTDKINTDELSQITELSVSAASSGFDELLNDDRALDIIGFLCNDDLFIDIDDVFDQYKTAYD